MQITRSFRMFLAITLSSGFAAAACAQTARPVLLARTPPMGWNSWNHFAQRVTDADVRAAADAMVANGMRDAGYIYVNIDDSWEGTRDADGVLHSNNKFPDMKALADYVHSKGLKLGIYSSPGPKTCAKYEGSLGHEAQDAKTYAEWGIDFLKYDLCSYGDVLRKEGHGDVAAAFPLQKQAYKKMHDALIATGRPIVYSLCQYGMNSVWEWGPEVGGNLWRTTGDIKDTYERMSLIGFAQAGLAKYAGPGHWNDPDMLEVGNGGMNGDEYRTHMSLWAMLAAPLLAGNDLSKMNPDTLAILENRDAIAIDQDPLGIQGDRLSAVGPLEIWSKPLSDGSKAVALFNRGELETPMTLRMSDVSLGTAVKLHDVWGDKDMTVLNGTYTAVVPKHGVVFLRIRNDARFNIQ
jgi:alpha-galactosidase